MERCPHRVLTAQMQLLQTLNNHLLQEEIILSSLTHDEPISGGCINDCYKIYNRDTAFFVKVNQREQFPDMFQKEANGLTTLRKTQLFNIPQFVAQFDRDNQSYLVLEFIEEGRIIDSSDQIQNWSAFGTQLTKLHQLSQEEFGFEEDNYIGSLHQKNELKNDWVTFFLECRLLPLIELGIEKGWAQKIQFRQIEGIAKMVEDEFPKEPPALLHGDLWSGNFLNDKKGNTNLIDPAVYYGHREMEIAFTQLFGGFHSEFYTHYNFNYPIQEDFQKRLSVLQLYPLLVHANLFGGHYVKQGLSVLNKF